MGTRTWGGLIGIGGYPNLIDGGYVTAPRWALYNPDGVFDIENKGVAPDHEVELDPAAWRRARTRSLAAAIDLVMKALRENPPRKGSVRPIRTTTRGRRRVVEGARPKGGASSGDGSGVQ